MRARIGANIKALARKRGLSLFRLSVLARVGSAQLYRVTRADAWPSPEWLSRVASALGVDASDLLGVASSPLDTRARVGTIGREVTPMLEPTKDEIYRFRLNTIDRARLDALSQRLEMPAAAAIRFVIREALEARGLDVQPKAAAKARKRGRR
jgi:transcriptional regulator with XRE-family HTH domain